MRQSKEQSINKIGHALHDLDPVCDRFSRTPELEQLSADLGIEQPLLLQSMYIFKQPHIGGEVTCHQDSTFIYTEPIAIAGLWFALEDATVENGCLWAIPSGHNCHPSRHGTPSKMLGWGPRSARPGTPPLGLKSRWRRAPEGGMRFELFDSTPWPEEKLVPLAVKKGTLIVLHGLLPHKSLENRSPRSRHAFTLHVIDSNCHYPADNWLQRSPSLPLRGFD